MVQIALRKIVGAEMTRRTFTNCCGLLKKNSGWSDVNTEDSKRLQKHRNSYTHPGFLEGPSRYIKVIQSLALKIIRSTS